MIPKETIDGISDLLLQGGAVAALAWIVSLLVSGKLHTSSEVDGLKRDKEDLLAVNKRISEALESSNKLLEDLVSRGRR